MRIHYQSDFKLIQTHEAGFSVPFIFVYYTGDNTYNVSYDGKTYRNCYLNGDGSLTVTFNSTGFSVGRLRCRREFHLPDPSFPDKILNLVTDDDTGITLINGVTDNPVVGGKIPPLFVVSSSLDFAEIDGPPKDTPTGNSLYVDTTNNVVYFGIANKGWWKTSVKNLTSGEVKVEGNTLLVEGASNIENATLVLDMGKVENNILILA